LENQLLDKPIYKYQIGTGNIKFYFGLKVHGNEITTKALFDFLNLLNNGSDLASKLLRHFTLLCSDAKSRRTVMPLAKMLMVDLNQDSQDLYRSLKAGF
jgi:hypothetical protein